MDCIIGHPRSGTSFITSLLNASVEVCAHEYLANLTSLAVSLPTAYYEGRAAPEEVSSLLEHYRNGSSPQVRIDSNWKLTWILPVFLEAYPAARVVHLVRDPRDAIRSCLELDFYGNLPELPEFRGDVTRNYWLSHMPKIRCADWDELDQLGKNCVFWNESQRLAREVLADHPHCLRVRLEDLLADDSAVAQLFEFLGVAPPSARATEVLRATKVNQRAEVKRRLSQHRKQRPPFSAWSEVERARLVGLCRLSAAAVGYDLC